MVDNDNQGQDEPEDAELVEAETVENSPTNNTQSEELDRVSTYSLRENGILYQISPQITNLGTEWQINAYGSAKGPLQFPNGISDEQAQHLGLSPETQAELNATLQAAKERGELPRVFRGQQRDKRQISDLQRSLGMEI
jgi:hypothetical protein